MTHEEKSVWLASLKVGDEVAVRYGRWGAGHYTIYRIERVTSTQLVSTRQSFRPVEVRFRKSDGRVIGDDGYNRIEPVTNDVREANEREKLTTRTGVQHESRRPHPRTGRQLGACAIHHRQ